MAPTWVQTDSGTNGNASTVTLASFAVGAGSDRSLVAVLAWMDNSGGPPTGSSVVFNTSEAFTFRARGQLTFAGNNVLTVEVWTLDNPTNATADVVATLSEANDAGDGIVLTVSEYTGANNGIGANVGQATGFTTDSTVTIATGAADSLIVGGLMMFAGGPVAVTPGTNTTERAEVHHLNCQSWAGEEPATGGSDTFNATHDSLRWVLAAVELKAAAGGGGGTVNTETAGTQSAAVAGGADQSVFTETGTAHSPAMAGGVDQSVFAEGGQATSSAAASGADQAVFAEQGGAASPGVIGGASQHIQRGREGAGVAPAVAGGVDTVTYTEQAGGYAPAVVGALDEMVYVETGSAAAGAVAGGAAEHITSGDRGGVQAPAQAGGADRVVFTEAGLGAAGASAGGAVEHIRNGGASDGNWVAFGDVQTAGGPRFFHGESIKDRMARERRTEQQPARVLEDEALLMLL